MITVEEIRRAVQGSWRLLLGDARGMTWFDLSLDGFWRSFFAMVLLLPVPIVQALARGRLALGGEVDPSTASGPAVMLVGLLSYVVAWIAFPMVLALLANPLGIGPRFVPYMVARNWTTLIGVVPGLLVTLAFVLDLAPASALGPGQLAALGFNLFYAWQVTRIACAAPPGLAGGLVALDSLLTLVVYTAADRLLGL